MKAVRSLPLLPMSAGWLLGIVLAVWLRLSPTPPLLGAVLVLVAALLFRSEQQARFVLLLLGVLLLGAWRSALADFRNDPQAVAAFVGAGNLELRGSVTTAPTLQGRGLRFLVALESLSRDGGRDWWPVHGTIAVLTPGTLPDDPYGAAYGDRIELRGRLQPPGPHDPPDLQATMAFPRVFIQAEDGNPLLVALYHLRLKLAAGLALSLPQPEAALLVALFLGLHTPALRPLAPLFSVTGTAHLIVPSGFKVSVLAALVATLLRPLACEDPALWRLLPAERRRATRRLWLLGLVQCAVIAVYTVLSGAGPAALRAGLMAILVILAPRLGRSYHVYTALAASAVLLSLLDPSVLWESGFQLSFLGTLGILLLTPLLRRPLQSLERLPAGHQIAEALAVTLAAQVATLPIFALTFEQLSLVAPLANMLTVPLLEALMLLALLLSAAGLLSIPLGVICGWAAWFPLRYVIAVVTLCAHLPAAWVSTAGWPLSAPLAWGYYALLAPPLAWLLARYPPVNGRRHGAAWSPRALSRRTLHQLQMALALLLILTTGLLSLLARGDGTLSVTFLSLAPAPTLSGGAVLVRTAMGKTFLIDGGPDATLLSTALDGRLPFWQRRLDLLLLTSPLRIHLGGLQDATLRFLVGRALDAGMLHPSSAYALWRRNLVQRGISYRTIRQGMVVAPEADLRLDALWPPSPLHRSGDESRDNALVLRLVTPGVRLLLLGEAAQSPYALQGLLAASPGSERLQADIVEIALSADRKAPSALGNLLRALHPALLIVLIEQGGPSARTGTERVITSTSGPDPDSLQAGASQVCRLTSSEAVEIRSDREGWSLWPASAI